MLTDSKLLKIVSSLVTLTLLALVSGNLWAAGSRVTTFDGTAGLKVNFFDVHCAGCHTGFTDSDWSIYADANAKSATINTRINLAESDPLFMPSGGSTVDDSLFQAWLGDSKPRYQSPYINNTVSTGSTSRIGTNNYNRSVSFTVNENGSDSTFTAYYRKGSDSWSSVSASNPAGTGGSGASGSDGTSSATLTNLECGNVYSVYLNGDNAATGSTNSVIDTISAITCNTGASLSGSPGNATEDSLFTWTPTITSGTGGSDSLTYSFSSTPTGSNPKPTINASTGEISWTPVEGQSSSSFTIQVSDANADTSITDTLAVTINVNPINDNSPVITTVQGDIPGATEDALFSVQLNATDVDGGDTETWDITAEDHAGMSITTGGLLTWTPPEGVYGDYDVTVRVRDAVNNQDTATFTISVTQDQSPPTIDATPIATQAATEGSLFSIDLNASDTDSPHVHTWAITSPVSLPDDMAIDNDGVLTWTPGSEADYTQSVTVEVTDDGGLTDSTSFDIDVTAIADNDPVITTVSMPGATEYVAYSQTLAFTDADTDGDSWTWSISSGPTPVTTNPLAIDPATGEVSWEAANNETSVTFTARVTDSRGDPHYDEREFTINVSAVNDPPSIDGTPIATQEVDEDALLTLDIDATDPDAGDVLSWSIISPASPPDDMSIDSNGVFTWTPSSEISLSQIVTVRVSDSGSLQDETSFTVNVTPVIDNAPVITSVQGDIPQATEDTAFSHTLTWTDGDLEGDGWTWSLTAQDDPDIAINASTGEISWTPAEGERGDFNISARVTDDGGLFDEIALVINVQKDNEAPVISGKPIAAQAATEDTLFSIDIDRTDGDIGDTESWQITSPALLPDDMAIDNNGVLTWTPGEGIDRAQNVTVQITDEGGLIDSTSFSINVTSVNDAPIFTAIIPDDAVEEHSTFTHTVSVSDSDPQDNDPDLLSNLSFSISDITPTPNSEGPSIDSTGQITWTPGDNDARTVDPLALSQDYVISVTVSDGGENDQGPVTQDFTLTVNLLDTDLDTIPDYEDNCVDTDNTDQANNDGDNLGDLCDPDDDNDGISDIAELFNGLDPFDADDALLDLDNDGLSNLAEFNNCTGGDIESSLECDNIQIDSVPPIITHSGHIDTIAKGYTTFVDYSASATDGIDGPVTVSANLNEKHLRPGDYVITWTAEDAANNIAVEEQFITIHPLLSLGGSQLLAEGASGFATLSFNGDIPAGDFPVTITYGITGTAGPGDLNVSPASPITINNSGELVNNELMLTIDTLNDGLNEGNETLQIILNSVSSGPALDSPLQHGIVITEGQVAPTAQPSAEQNTLETTSIYGDLGTVTVYANALDGNGDTLGFDWSASDAILAGTPSGNSFSFEPPILDEDNLPAVFTVRVQVSDGTSQINKSLSLTLISNTLNLTATDSDGDGINDDIEGAGDSDGDGIPDYLDAYDNPANLLYTGQENDGQASFIETESGYQLSLGSLALANGNFNPTLNISAIDVLGINSEDPGYVHFGQVYNFVITGFSPIVTTGFVVIPLTYHIPPGAELRLFDGTSWLAFTENSNNSISSTNNDENGCPAISGENYQNGLLPYRSCILIKVSDGGPNDMDSQINGTVELLVGLALADNADIFEPENTPDESSRFKNDGPAGTGFMSFHFLLGLLLLGFVRMTLITRYQHFRHPKNNTL